MEAALIVGIIAAFLIQRGRRRALRPMWLRCRAGRGPVRRRADHLSAIGRSLPFRQREVLEGILALVAVGGRHIHDRVDAAPRAGAEGTLEEHAELGPGRGLGVGRSLGWLSSPSCARDSRPRSSCSRRSRAQRTRPRPDRRGPRGCRRGRARVRDLPRGHPDQPGPVLQDHRLRPGAGGCWPLASAVHEFAEAGVGPLLQASGLRPIVARSPGDRTGPRSSPGCSGLQPVPTVAEILVWLAYAIPMGAYVLWPQPRRVAPATAASRAALNH